MPRYSGGLKCDLCVEPTFLGSRTDFDRHMREEHGTVSLKPRSVAMQAKKLLGELSAIMGKPHVEMSVEQAEANAAKFREEDRRREEAAKQRRLAMEDIDRSFLRRSLRAGWLTFRAPKGAAGGMAVMPFQTGEANANFVYHEDGSWLQFETARQRDAYVYCLEDYLSLDASHPPEERLGQDETANMERFVGLAKKARPWSEDDLPPRETSRYGG